MKRFGKKLARELKWLVVSAFIVASAIGLVIGVANFCQWRVEQNEIRFAERGY